MICRNTQANSNTVEWLETYFDLCGDFQPNHNEIHLDTAKYIDIYTEYVADFEADHEVPLEYKTWRQVWLDVFPYVSIRQYKAVSGKV